MDVNSKGMLTKEQIMETVVYRMMNKEANAELLNQIPHIRILDLAATYYCILSMEGEQHIGLLISHEICQYYGIQKEELDTAARWNTVAGVFTCQTANEALGLPEGNLPDFMYILTNGQRLYGASVILYEDYFRILANRIGGDVYILPSSIHELIAIPAVDENPFELQEIVKEINGSSDLIRRNEVLSNNVYQYSRDGGGLMRVTLDCEKRIGSTPTKARSLSSKTIMHPL